MGTTFIVRRTIQEAMQDTNNSAKHHYVYYILGASNFQTVATESYSQEKA